MTLPPPSRRARAERSRRRGATRLAALAIALLALDAAASYALVAHGGARELGPLARLSPGALAPALARFAVGSALVAALGALAVRARSEGNRRLALGALTALSLAYLVLAGFHAVTAAIVLAG